MSDMGLNETKRKLAEMMLRYRMLLLSAAVKALGLPSDVILSHLNELLEGQLIRSFLFLNDSPRYELSPFGCKVLGVHKCFSRPLGGQALPERYGVLWYCTIEPDAERVIFSPAAQPERFPHVKGERLPQPYFFIDRAAGRPMLGYLLVDHGGQKRNFLSRSADKASRLRKLFPEWADKGLLRMTVLTTHEQREKQLRNVMPKILGPFAGEVVVVPGMGQLLGGGGR